MLDVGRFRNPPIRTSYDTLSIFRDHNLPAIRTGLPLGGAFRRNDASGRLEENPERKGQEI